MKQLLKYILSLIMTNLQFAESKFGIIIAINSGIIVFSANYLSSKYILFLVFDILVIVSCCISLFCCFLGIRSKHININSLDVFDKNRVNLTYFKDIQFFTAIDYLNEITKRYNFPIDYNYDDFEIDLANQIIANSKSAVRKFEMFNKSVFWLFISILFIIIMFLIGVLL